jgi:VIT1/CCC1 family predicted Fe2+/Mn2+ transporter
MPQTPHVEKHFESSLVVRDVVIGMADGLTVPFALAAGLTGAVSASHTIIVAGLAEVAAERRREEMEIVERTDDERHEVIEILESYGLTHEQTTPILAAFEARPKVWVDWMMRFELGLEEPDPKRALTSAATIAGSYVVGGLIPLAPYMFTPDAHTALLYSVVSTIIALAVFGYVKGHFTGAPKLRSSLRTAAIGGLAAGAAYLIARLIS